MSLLVAVLAAVAVAWILAYRGAPLWAGCSTAGGWR